MRKPFRARAVGAILGLAVVATACGSGDGATEGDPIRIASFNFNESVIVAEIYAQGVEANGYTVERQRFPYQTYVEEESWLRVETPRPVSIVTRALRYAPSGEARGPLVDVGLGRTRDLAGKDFTGKIALAQRGEISFQEKADNAARAGAGHEQIDFALLASVHRCPWPARNAGRSARWSRTIRGRPRRARAAARAGSGAAGRAGRR